MWAAFLGDLPKKSGRTKLARAQRGGKAAKVAKRVKAQQGGACLNAVEFKSGFLHRTESG